MKTIVTHISPDLDAIGSAWLIKRYMPGWDEANLAFVPAGTTLGNSAPDVDPNIIHVDTGLGQFDHHQTEDRNLCATKKVYQYLLKNENFPKKDEEALGIISEYVTMDDNFGDVRLHDPTADIYDFCLHRLINGLKAVKPQDEDRASAGFDLLDAVLQVLKNKLNAKKEIEKGFVFTSHWGKTLASDSKNDEIIKLAQKMGYNLVIRKDPEEGFLRIKTLPDKKYDLTPLYDRLKKLDPQATWFLHVSKNMLLNGSVKNPDNIPTRLSLQKVIEIVKNIE